MPVYSLARAATEAGRSRSTVLRAIQTGRLSAVRDATSGTWSIDAAELRRAYPAGANGHGDGHAGTAADDRGDSAALIAAKDALISEQRAVIDDLRRRLDKADERILLLLTDQREVRSPAATAPATVADSPAPARRRRWWRLGR